MAANVTITLTFPTLELAEQAIALYARAANWNPDQPNAPKSAVDAGKLILGQHIMQQVLSRHGQEQAEAMRKALADVKIDAQVAPVPEPTE